MPRAERNRNLFASAIAGSTSSGSTTSRRARLGTNPSEPYLVEEERATTTTRTETIKSAIFEIFGESQLPRINFQSSLAEINSWKSDQRVKDAYRKLFDVFSEDRTYVQVILERVWKSKKRISNMHIAWGVAIAQLFLNPDVKGIMISENLLKKQIKINFRKLQQKRSLRPEEGELDAEETSEEESEEEEEEGKSPKRRKTSRGHVPSSGRAPSPGLVSPPLTSPSRLLPEFFDNEGEGRQRTREGRRESRRQHSQEDQRVKDAYRKLFDVFSEDRTYVQVILERVWKSKKRISNMHIAWGVAIAQLFLNPDVKGIMISENLLKKQIKINFRKLQQKRPLRPEEGELDAEETSEEESEEEEEEGKSPKRRKTSRGHVPSSGRAPSPGLVSPPLTSPSRLLPEFFDNEGEGRQRTREGRRESRRQHSQEGEEGDTTGGDTERAEIVAEQ
ncbi:hypothetical protein Glove_551g1 [Diversispora epigaea]|uniref:Uncharacterized protein n=1 Tax=Diversispora epigaea TaxID=1348612 RepID=A0A397GK61_9GLOM|nr:hypothetical protein Glove_551g1 [Diversispora epigaea]